MASCLGREAHLESEQVPLGMALSRSETARGIAMQGPFFQARQAVSLSVATTTHSLTAVVDSRISRLAQHRNCATHIHLSLVWRNSICGAIAAKFS